MSLHNAFPEVPLRDVWVHEAQHFTRWLAANLDRLGAALGLSLRALSPKAVGDARIADLFARDEQDGSLVLIENQLEPADDAHLGQILAYLAGSDARTLIWIAKDFAASRLEVVRWLNLSTVAGYRFFAVQVQIVRRNGFDVDCVFNVLEAPSDWIRPETPSLTSSFGFAASFWAAHRQWRPEEAAASRQVGPRCRWRPTKIRSVVIGLHVEPKAAEAFLRGRQGVTRDAALEILSPLGETIEREFGVPFNDASCAVLALTRLALDMTDPANWPQASEWLAGRAQRYDALLRTTQMSVANCGHRAAERSARSSKAGGSLSHDGTPTSIITPEFDGRCIGPGDSRPDKVSHALQLCRPKS